MNFKQLSSRERWLLALLPAALVLVAWLFIPTGAQEREQLERVIANAPSDAQLHRELAELSRSTRDSRKELKHLTSELNQLTAATDKGSLGSNRQITDSMAGQFQYLDQRFDELGIAVIATESVRSTASQGDGEIQTWRVTVVSSWSRLAQALSTPNLMPSGLRVDALAMDPPRRGTKLRRWVMTLSSIQRSPNS